MCTYIGFIISGPLAEQQLSDAHAAVGTPLLQQQTETEQQGLSVASRLTESLPPNPPSSASLDSNPASADTAVTKVEKPVVPMPSERKVPEPLHQGSQSSQPSSGVVAGGLGGGRAPQQLQLQPPADWSSKPIGRSSSVFKVLPSRAGSRISKD